LLPSPLFDIAPEIGEHRFERREAVNLFPRADVPMIALARLVVVAKYADAIDHQGQPIFERVRRAWRGIGQPPDDQLRKRPIIEDVSP